MKFRAIYVIQKTDHDFSSLVDVCKHLVFLTDGTEKTEDLVSIIFGGLIGFNPATDAIVPVGNVFANIFTGSILQLKFGRLEGSIKMLIYKDKQYRILGDDSV